MVTEINISLTVTCNTFGKFKIGSQSVHFTYLIVQRLLVRLLAGYNQTGKFPWTDINILVHIKDCNIIGIFYLRIVMQVQERNIFTITNTNRTVVRFIDTNHAKHIQVCKRHIFTIIHLNRLALHAFTAFLFCLHTIYFPVGHLTEPYFIPYMMFDGHSINPSRSTGVIGIETICGIGSRRPNILESTTTIVGYP